MQRRDWSGGRDRGVGLSVRGRGSGQEGGGGYAGGAAGLGGALVQRAQLHEDLLTFLLGAAQRDYLECVPPTRRRAVPNQLDEAGAALAQHADVLERPEPLHTTLAARAALGGGGCRRRATWGTAGSCAGVYSCVCAAQGAPLRHLQRFSCPPWRRRSRRRVASQCPRR